MTHKRVASLPLRWRSGRRSRWGCLRAARDLGTARRYHLTFLLSLAASLVLRLVTDLHHPIRVETRLRASAANRSGNACQLAPIKGTIMDSERKYGIVRSPPPKTKLTFSLKSSSNIQRIGVESNRTSVDCGAQYGTLVAGIRPCAVSCVGLVLSCDAPRS